MDVRRATEPYEVPKAPVRDDTALSEHEDLDRAPDGVPHSVIGMTFGFSIMLALLVAFMFAVGGTFVRVLAIAIVLVAVPVLIRTLSQRAERERDHIHPSR